MTIMELGAFVLKDLILSNKFVKSAKVLVFGSYFTVDPTKFLGGYIASIFDTIGSCLGILATNYAY